MGKFIVEKHNGESIWRLYENEYSDIAGEEAYLTPYTEPDLEQVRKEGYEQGYKDMLNEVNKEVRKSAEEIHAEITADAYKRGYDTGLSDAWEAAIDAVEFGVTYAKAFDVNTGESKELFKEGNDALKKAVERLKGLPSEQPERQKGEWIDYTEDGFVECPFCHSATNCDGNRSELHFCFSCGAELR